MDLHDYADVAENYDYYLSSVTNLSNDDLVNFHLSLAEAYGKKGILDIACGTGVLTIPLVKAGYDTIAFDLSPPMVEVTKRKLIDENLSANVFVANMADFKFNRKFSLAIIARSGFMHLLAAEEQKSALDCIYDHLETDGILTLNTFQPHPMMQAEQMKTSPDDYTFRAEYINKDGNKEKIYNAITYNYLTQVMSGNWKFETFDKNLNIIDSRIRPLAMRQTYKQEMEYLFQICGFDVLNIYNDYKKSPFNGNCIWVVKKRV